MVKSNVGKNFSLNNRGQRKKSDFYETPYSLTQQFIDSHSIPYTNILEPAAGNGAIVKVLQANNFNVTAYDAETNFLAQIVRVEAIITNPPFSLAFEFIQHAKKISNWFAFLLPLSYLHGKQRHDYIYTDREFPLECVYVFTRYPMLGESLREDGKYNTGMMVYSWFVWNKFYNAEPCIRWIDNNHFVLKGSDNEI